MVIKEIKNAMERAGDMATMATTHIITIACPLSNITSHPSVETLNSKSLLSSAVIPLTMLVFKTVFLQPSATRAHHTQTFTVAVITNIDNIDNYINIDNM